MERGRSEKTNSPIIYLSSYDRSLYIGRGAAFANRDSSLYGARATRRIASNSHSQTDTANRRCDPIPPVENAFSHVMEESEFCGSYRARTFHTLLHRLRLCNQLFSTNKSQKITYLTGLNFNLAATVLKLCAQEVVSIPQHPQALYPFDSTYLLTSVKRDFTLQNLTEQGNIAFRVVKVA